MLFFLLSIKSTCKFPDSISWFPRSHYRVTLAVAHWLVRAGKSGTKMNCVCNVHQCAFSVCVCVLLLFLFLFARCNPDLSTVRSALRMPFKSRKCSVKTNISQTKSLSEVINHLIKMTLFFHFMYFPPAGELCASMKMKFSSGNNANYSRNPKKVSLSIWWFDLIWLSICY